MSKPFSFELTKTLADTLGRVGIIHTPHGDINTPNFAAVGTMGMVKFLSPEDLRSVGVEIMLSNAYHLRGKAEEYEKAGGLAKKSGWHGPTTTDSGGFQVMSLGTGLGKVVSMDKKDAARSPLHTENLAKITEEGVEFTDPWTNERELMTPERAIQIEHQLGADIIMAFDELTSIGDTYEYNIAALDRTERWAIRCLAEHKKLGGDQALYGVLQGGHYEDLRKRAATFMATQDFAGYGLGGAFAKEDLGQILQWVNEILPAEKPRHLLGLSRPDDIFVGVEGGADTFDCVAPTREARHGKIYTMHGDLVLRKGKYAEDQQLLDPLCDCPTCKDPANTRASLRALLKSPESKDKEEYYRLASIHNLRFIVRLFEQIRQSIKDDTYTELRKTFFKNYYS